MNNLVDHATYELKRAGLFDEDSDYDGMLGSAVLELIGVFANQGHSGMSAEMVTDLFGRLARYQALTPLTDDPAEWEDRTEISGTPLWQNKRDSAVFSNDGGKTTYRVDGADGT